MWASKVTLLLLPAIAYCRITIRINPGNTEDETTVSFSGSDKAVISDTERKTFKLDEASLNRAVEKYKGKACTSNFVKPPTPYGDVYENYGWDVVERTLKPVGYKIIGIKKKPDMVVTAEYVNTHDEIPATYSTSIQKTYAEQVSHAWSTSGSLTIGQEITYSIGVGAANVGGSTSLSGTAAWGKNNEESRTVTCGSTSTIETTVPPGKGVVATLTSKSGTLEIDIFYEATVSGDVFCNYEGKYDGHHFWAWSLWALQREGNLPRVIKSSERISVGFVMDSKLSISK